MMRAWRAKQEQAAQILDRARQDAAKALERLAVAAKRAAEPKPVAEPEGDASDKPAADDKGHPHDALP